MAPPKGIKKEVPKRDISRTIDDPVNMDSWKCVVVMAVEKTSSDSFVIKEFIDESSTGRRQEVGLIDYSFVLKLLNDFENEEFSYKYPFLVNFSSVFQEAVEYLNKQMEIPVFVLVKVVKALLFNLREESLLRIKKAETELYDPVKAMAERPVNFGVIEAKNKEMTKKGDNRLKMRPPSVTKQDTELLKRNEKAKDTQRIDDAPRNAYFSLYVLLTGFFNPDFPLELIKAGIPLHALLCIDTSYSGVKEEDQSESFDNKSQDIQNFWKAFLKILWDSEAMFHFKDIIFQMYLPQRLLCEKKKLREFIYKEISYLMYDLSDLKQQLCNYLNHFRVWDVTERAFDMKGTFLEFENLPNECVTVPIILQFIIDAICRNDEKHPANSSFVALSAPAESYQSDKEMLSGRLTELEGSTWSQKLEERKYFDLLNIYNKIKELDIKYDMEDKSIFCTDSEKSFNEWENSQATCNFQPLISSENIREALSSSDGIFGSYWKKYQKNLTPIYGLDYCLYSLLMTRVACPYQMTITSQSPSVDSVQSYKKYPSYDLIENLNNEMCKPHFTVTDGSRTILKSRPFSCKNIPRNFFCPEELKIVSPAKLKASSAPEFRFTPNSQIQTLFMSEAFPWQVEKTPFEALEGFIDECLFSNTNDFSLLEFLSKPKILEKEYKHWKSYNCIDHSYSILNDCIFIILHNRKDKDNIYHETFNESLKTTIGLRDFYEYVTEDESEWLKNQEQLTKSTMYHSDITLKQDDLRNFKETDFWLIDSIKHRYFQRNSDKLTEIKEASPNSEEIMKSVDTDSLRRITAPSKAFEAYDVSNTMVQFSGLKTVFYTDGCSLAVQLIERLYGDQELGIHVTGASHTLHLYSYVCPEPHIQHPFTFHLNYENGIILAFERRFIETFEEVEEIIESRTMVKGKKNSSEVSTRIIKKLIPKSVKDEEFIYNMAASLPNGLTVRTVRKIVRPCYLKQNYQVNGSETARVETSRLFLPNGNLVKMMRNGSVEILKTDGTIVTASLSDLVYENQDEGPKFKKFDIVSGDGYSCTFEQRELTSSKRFQIFQNTDVETGQVFFRRRDGTNYMLQSDGTLFVQFKDGTKMSSSVLESTDMPESSLKNDSDSIWEKETFGETDFDEDFVFIHTKIIIEHPDYATVIFDSQTQMWRILFPFESSITVNPNGHFTVDVDTVTELTILNEFIRMNNFSCERQLQSIFTADLSVFENKEEHVYCQMVNSTGKTFIVEGNSNCYILSGDESSQEDIFQEDSQEGSAEELQSLESEMSELLASADLQNCPSVKIDKGNKLSRENKYFVIKRDITGLELLHVDDVRKELKRQQKGCLVYTQNIPNTEHRCFVSISPKPKEKSQKWMVDTILPNPKYEPSASRKTLSSTYGVPPSWMHPFPKRKIKFVVPEPLTCRVFVETKKTNLSPQVGALDCYNYESNEINEVKYSRIPTDGAEEYFQKLSNDDQDILKEMYALAAESLINEKKRSIPVYSEKLEHYLEMSRYIVEMREYHKRCIRYQIVPNFFDHPAGMSWLILNELIDKLKLPHTTPPETTVSSDKIVVSSTSEGGFSYEEVEYNLSVSAGQSFSDLSYRSNLSVQTAPAELRIEGVCRCKIKGKRNAASSPVIKCYGADQTTDENSVYKSHSRICEFQEDDIEMVEKTECQERKIGPMSLEDLMYLGLI